MDTRLMIRQDLLRVRRPCSGAQMSDWIAIALAIAITTVSATAAVNAGPCTPGSMHQCFNIPGKIDFTSVPEISKRIAREEKTGQQQKQPTAEPATPVPYTGPTFGANPRPGRTPLIGYSWSLE